MEFFQRIASRYGITISLNYLKILKKNETCPFLEKRGHYIIKAYVKSAFFLLFYYYIYYIIIIYILLNIYYYRGDCSFLK